MALPICPELGPSRSQPYSNSNSRTPAPPLLLIPAKPTFLGLPIEVRFMIYRYLLPEIFRVSKVSKESDFFNKNNNHRYQNVRDSSPQFTELLEVCSQVRKEAAPILYEMVYALHWQDVQLWFWCYRNNHVQYINTLAVDFAELPPRPGPRMIGATGPDVPWLNGIRCLTSLPGLRRCLAIIRCGPSSGIGVDQYKVLRNALREVADCLRRHQRHLKFELQLLFVFEGHGLQEFLVPWTQLAGMEEFRYGWLVLEFRLRQLSGHHWGQSIRQIQPEWVEKFRPVHDLEARTRRNIQAENPLGSSHNPIVLD